MQIRHWFFVISVLLFVTGVGLVIAGGRATRRAPAAVQATATITPIASVKQIMKGITGPAANAVFNAVGSTITAKGIEEKAPKTPEEWEALEDSGAALVESGNLMLVGSRVIDKGEWVKQSLALIEGGKKAVKAAQAKNP